jgi:hypothetical protein
MGARDGEGAMESGDTGVQASLWSYERSWEVFAVVLLLAPVVLLASYIFGATVPPDGSGWDRLLFVAGQTSYSVWPVLVLAGTVALLRVARDWPRPMWLLAFVLGAGGVLLSLFATYRALTDSGFAFSDVWAFRGATVAAVLSGGLLAAISAWIARPGAFPQSPPLPEGNEEEWTQL